MAESDPEPEIPSDSSTHRNLSTSLFGIPGFLAGFGAKSSPDSDSIRSPTSPLEIGVFSNLRKPVSIIRYARSSSEKGYKKERNWNKVVGLGIVNSLVDGSTSNVLGSLKLKNIIFGPQVRPNSASSVKSYHGSLDSSLRSKSLPSNYVASKLSQTKCLDSQLSGESLVFDNEEAPVGKNTTPLCFSDSNVPSSLSILASNQSSGSENLCSDFKTKKMSSPLVIGSSLESENSLEAKHSTVPIPIVPSQRYVGSLSAREIELSEDYTCIISHGPNPKTIHIFGDCVLECHANDSDNFGKDEESRNRSTREAKSFDPVRPDEVLTFCYACKRNFEDGEENCVYRGDKVFCSFDCCSGNISEEETEMVYQKSCLSSSGSSFHEDLFLLGMPIAM